MNRGSNLKLVAERMHGVGFNEAPIHESGKYGCRGRGCACDLGLQ